MRRRRAVGDVVDHHAAGRLVDRVEVALVVARRRAQGQAPDPDGSIGLRDARRQERLDLDGRGRVAEVDDVNEWQRLVRDVEQVQVVVAHDHRRRIGRRKRRDRQREPGVRGPRLCRRHHRRRRGLGDPRRPRARCPRTARHPRPRRLRARRPRLRHRVHPPASRPTRPPPQLRSSHRGLQWPRHPPPPHWHPAPPNRCRAGRPTATVHRDRRSRRRTGRRPARRDPGTTTQGVRQPRAARLRQRRTAEARRASSAG